MHLGHAGAQGALRRPLPFAVQVARPRGSLGTRHASSQVGIVIYSTLASPMMMADDTMEFSRGCVSMYVCVIFQNTGANGKGVGRPLGWGVQPPTFASHVVLSPLIFMICTWSFFGLLGIKTVTAAAGTFPWSPGSRACGRSAPAYVSPRGSASSWVTISFSQGGGVRGEPSLCISMGFLLIHLHIHKKSLSVLSRA